MSQEHEQIPMFARSPMAGKKSSDVKARVTDETKEALARKCHELGITESEYIDRLLCMTLFGVDEVINREREKAQRILGEGLWNKVDPHKGR